MIAEKEQIEQPGKNAIQHACEMEVEIPGDDGEDSTFKPCRIMALVQCGDCAAWLCGTVELDHALICVRCGSTFCPMCFHDHRLSRKCEEQS